MDGVQQERRGGLLLPIPYSLLPVPSSYHS
jgi:hypothetical protein